MTTAPPLDATALTAGVTIRRRNDPGQILTLVGREELDGAWRAVDPHGNRYVVTDDEVALHWTLPAGTKMADWDVAVTLLAPASFLGVDLPAVDGYAIERMVLTWKNRVVGTSMADATQRVTDRFASKDVHVIAVRVSPVVAR